MQLQVRHRAATEPDAGRSRLGLGHATVSSGPVSPTATVPIPTMTPSPAGPAGAPVPKGFSPASVTFVSLQTGWVLGATCPTCTVSLLRTRDGGRTWASVPGPATVLAPDQSAGVHEVRFADLNDGWVLGAEIWATHDGGSYWARSPRREVSPRPWSSARRTPSRSSPRLRAGMSGSHPPRSCPSGRARCRSRRSCCRGAPDGLSRMTGWWSTGLVLREGPGFRGSRPVRTRAPAGLRCWQPRRRPTWSRPARRGDSAGLPSTSASSCRRTV